VLDLDAAAIDSVIMRFHLALFIFFTSLQVTLSKDIEHGLLLVNGAQAKAQTDDNFICATIDWWPHDKCNDGYCSWGHSSIVNLVSIFVLSSV
jgi:heparanase